MAPAITQRNKTLRNKTQRNKTVIRSIILAQVLNYTQTSFRHDR